MSRDGASTTSLGNLHQCLTTLIVKKFPYNPFKSPLLLSHFFFYYILLLLSVKHSCVGGQSGCTDAWLEAGLQLSNLSQRGGHGIKEQQGGMRRRCHRDWEQLEGREGKGREGKGREGKGREGKGKESYLRAGA